MQKYNSLFTEVEEREVKGEMFQVTHRILSVSRDTYLQVVESEKESFSETAVQSFVDKYLKWCGDEDGVIGMVRFDEEGDNVVLDAAVRYRVNAEKDLNCQGIPS